MPSASDARASAQMSARGSRLEARNARDVGVAREGRVKAWETRCATRRDAREARARTDGEGTGDDRWVEGDAREGQTERAKTTFRKWMPVVDANGADVESSPRGSEGCAYECAEEDEGGGGGGGGGGGA